MKKYREIVINVNGKNNRSKEIEILAKKLNITKDEIAKKINNMYIRKGAKYEEYFRT